MLAPVSHIPGGTMEPFNGCIHVGPAVEMLADYQQLGQYSVTLSFYAVKS